MGRQAVAWYVGRQRTAGLVRRSCLRSGGRHGGKAGRQAGGKQAEKQAGRKQARRLRQVSDRWQAVKKTNFVLGICGKGVIPANLLWHCDNLSKNEVLNLGRSFQGRIVKNDISHATQGS